MIYAILSLIFASLEIIFLDKVLQEFNPFIFMSLFYLSAFTFLFLNNKIFKKQKIITKEVIKNKKILSIYIFTGAFGSAIWFMSLYLMGASMLALFNVLYRVFIIYYGTVKLNEKMTKLQYLLTSFVLIGSVFLIGDSNDSQVIGLITCSIAYLLFAFSDISQKKIANKVNWNSALVLRQFVQLLFFTSIALTHSHINNIDILSVINANIIFWAFVCSMLGAVLGKITHYKAIQKMDLNRVTLIEQLKSVVVFFIAFLFMEEELTQNQLIAGFVMLISVFFINFLDYLITKKKKKEILLYKKKFV